MKTTEKRREASRRYRERNREAVLYHKRNARLRRFGLEPADLTRMLDEQQHACLICARALRREGRGSDSAHIDHCHGCGDVRGLLCKRCNGLVGYIESTPPPDLAAAILWVEEHRRPECG